MGSKCEGSFRMYIQKRFPKFCDFTDQDRPTEVNTFIRYYD